MIVVLTLLVLMQPAQQGEEELRVRVDRAPPEVAAFIERRAGCNHWQGEEPYDRERAAEIAGTLRELRCGRIERDERALVRKYRNRSDVIQLLCETRDILGW